MRLHGSNLAKRRDTLCHAFLYLTAWMSSPHNALLLPRMNRLNSALEEKVCEIALGVALSFRKTQVCLPAYNLKHCLRVMIFNPQLL